MNQPTEHNRYAVAMLLTKDSGYTHWKNRTLRISNEIQEGINDYEALGRQVEKNLTDGWTIELACAVQVMPPEPTPPQQEKE